MIRGEHATIRTAGPDDAPYLLRVYRCGRPMAALLDYRREPILPGLAELEEMLGREDALKDVLHAVEDTTGDVRGFCSLRGVNHESGFADLAFLFHDDADLLLPLAAEALLFARDRARLQLGIRKLLAHCLDTEAPLRDFCLANSFTSDGVQREVFFTQGRWYDMETLTLAL